MARANIGNRARVKVGYAYEYSESIDRMREVFSNRLGIDRNDVSKIDKAIRDEYTRLRDIVHKRVKRAEEAGVLRDSDVLSQFSGPGALPTSKGKSTEELLGTMGKMARMIDYQATGTLTDIKDTHKRKEEAWKDIVGDSLDDILEEGADPETINRMISQGMQMLESVGLGWLKYRYGKEASTFYRDDATAGSMVADFLKKDIADADQYDDLTAENFDSGHPELEKDTVNVIKEAMGYEDWKQSQRSRKRRK